MTLKDIQLRIIFDSRGNPTVEAEAFSETNYHPIAYLLRTKCTAIANSMNIPINKNAIKVYNN